MGTYLDDASTSLMTYWRRAELPLPIVIVGGGRWGRTWAAVIANARGTSTGIAIAARTDVGSARRWLLTQNALDRALLVPSLDEALRVGLNPVAAIIASRPRDHVRDSLEALERGLHVLVEKPISPTAIAGKPLLAAAQAVGRILAVGTEFAFLPAFHAAAAALKRHTGQTARLTLLWNDPAHELRDGEPKKHHGETSILIDLLAHAVSIFGIFAPRSEFDIADVDLSANGDAGRLVLCDKSGGRFVLLCNRAASVRRRELEVDIGAANATIDFSAHPPEVMFDGKPYQIHASVAALDSTLRLELGAFLTDVTGCAPARTAISSGLSDFLRLQSQLEQALN